MWKRPATFFYRTAGNAIRRYNGNFKIRNHSTVALSGFPELSGQLLDVEAFEKNRSSTLQHPFFRNHESPSGTHAVLFGDNSETLTILSSQTALEVPLIWLRDSCRCPACYSQGAYQRTSATIDTEIKLSRAEVIDGKLEVFWSDGHETSHKLEEIEATFQTKAKNSPSKKHVWNRSFWTEKELPTLKHDEVFTEKGLRKLLENVEEFGFGLVTGCDASEKSTENLVRQVAPPMPTTFGTMWTFTADMARGDTAYSNVHLQPHTDTTYFSDPCRIQVFHCLDREGCTGGQTVLVDGFHCAEEIDSESFQLLSTISQECIYQETNLCYKWTDTVLTRDETSPDRLKRVRFNMYDRSSKPPVCPVWQMPAYYKSLKRFADLTQSRRKQLHLTLTPGTVIFIDNWRVLHGRTGFAGRRVLSGCYMSNDEFSQAQRKHGVI